jgi:D-3-phosphoglycerate dehydrogenase
MPTIFLTHHAEALDKYFGAAMVDELRRIAEVRTNPLPRTLTAPELVDLAAGCELVISDRRTAAPRELFERLPALVAFQRVAVDIRNVDVEAASRAGVLVTRATPGFDAAVSEWVLATMLDLARHVSAYVIDYRAAEHAPAMRVGRQLRGSRLGIIGCGAIGRYLAGLAVAMGMGVDVADPFASVSLPGVEQVSLDTLLARCDFVVCLAVANAQTENLMNARAFASMKRSAFFINASRGELVDEAALLAALEQCLIAGAALDVGREADQMPSRALAARTDVIATPHIAGHTPQAIAHLARDVLAQAGDIVRGRMPQGAVNAASATRLASLGP